MKYVTETLILLALLAVLIYGCGYYSSGDLMPDDVHFIGNDPVINYARNATNEYFHTSVNKYIPVYHASVARIQASNGGCRNAVACMYAMVDTNIPLKIAISGETDFDVCWQAMHEYGHVAQYTLREPYSHQPIDFFNVYVYTKCGVYAD